MRSIIDKHYNELRKDKVHICCNVEAWYNKETQYGKCSNLAYFLEDFIAHINTKLHINIKYRLSKGLPVYGKES